MKIQTVYFIQAAFVIQEATDFVPGARWSVVTFPALTRKHFNDISYLGNTNTLPAHNTVIFYFQFLAVCSENPACTVSCLRVTKPLCLLLECAFLLWVTSITLHRASSCKFTLQDYFLKTQSLENLILTSVMYRVSACSLACSLLVS